MALASPTAWASGVKTETLKLDNVTYDQAVVKSAPGAAGKAEANAEGGGLKRLGTGPAELTKITLTGNKALVESAEANGLSASGGGAFLSGFESLSIVGGKVSGNLASAQNGAFAHGGGLALDKIGRIALSGLDFSGNAVKADGTGETKGYAGHGPSSGARGGALSIYNQGRAEPVFVPSELMKVSLAGSRFSGNSAEADGKGTLAAGGAVAVLGHIEAEFDGSGLKGAMFSKNKAVAGPDSNGGAEGGAVLIVGNPFRDLAGDLPPTAVFNQVAFEGNTVESQVLDNESMDVRGGAVSLQGLDGKVIFRDCAFSGNQLKTLVAESAKGRGRARGGAVFSYGGLLIENSAFKNNTGSSPGSVLGGALEVDGRGSVIKNSTFESNTAQGGSQALSEKYKGPIAGFGGALYLSGQMTIADSAFTKNRATGLKAEGGAIFVGHKASLTLVDTSITDNSAIGTEAASGGAIEVAAGGKLVIGVSAGKTMTVSGNKAGTSLETARASGIFLAAPDPDKAAPAPPADGRPPRPEPDDLIIKTAPEASLIMRDPIEGEAAKITKDGPGQLTLAGANSAAAWKIKAGSLNLMTDEKGQGSTIKVSQELSFAEKAGLSLVLPSGQPHSIEAAILSLPPDFKITVTGAGNKAPEKGTVLKLSGGADLQGLAGKSYAGSLSIGKAVYDYSLDWNEEGELVFSPTRKP